MNVDIFMDVGYIISQLDEIIMYPSSKTRAWLQMGHAHFLNLSKFLDITLQDGNYKATLIQDKRGTHSLCLQY